MIHDLFISYSYQGERDKRVAEAICTTLEAANIGCWMAPRDAIPGKGWAESIIKAIEASHIMVLVFSENSNQSLNVMREAEKAVEKNVTIIPFRIDDINPSENLEYPLSSTQWLDAITPPMEKHLDELV